MRLLLLWLWLAIGSFMIGSISVTHAASDSTNLPATTTAPKQLMTVLVTHIPPGAGWWANGAIQCPVPNTGGSDVVNPPTLKLVRSFPSGPGSGTGYLAYQCEETYWNTSPYYLSLVNNTTTTCVPNPAPAPPVGTGVTETCSIKSDGYLNGYLPIHFVVKTPRQTIVRNTAMGGSGSYNRIGTAHFNRGYAKINIDTPLISVQANFPTQLEFSTITLPFGTHFLWIEWQMWYGSSDGWGNGYVDSNALAHCPEANMGGLPGGYFPFGVTTDMIGKTCDISCDQGQWFLKPIPGDPAGGPPTTFTSITPSIDVYSGIGNVTINCHY